jgi:tRNA(Leu) C34 or U34 (ribose-2'-O)-methylase TrmL
MCTVRHQPELFIWLSASHSTLLQSIGIDPDHEKNIDVRPSLLHIPIVFACIEKVANLHRILMLCYDYDKCSLDSADVSRSSLLLLKVVVVMPMPQDCTIEENDIGLTKNAGSCSHRSSQSNKATTNKRNTRPRKSLLEYYDEAIKHFHSVIFGESKDQFTFYRPKIVYEDEIIEEMSNISATSNKRNCADDQLSTLIGIDLHSHALTLDGAYRNYKNPNRQHLDHTHQSTSTYLALQKLQNAQVLVFGYESTGIPEFIQSCLNEWIQIPCRSSINVVASMSIIFDALFG